MGYSGKYVTFIVLWKEKWSLIYFIYNFILNENLS